MRTVASAFFLMHLLILISGCGGDVHLQEPTPSDISRKDGKPSPPPLPIPEPTPAPTEHHVETFYVGVPSGSPVIHLLLYPSATLNGVRNSIRESLSAFVDALALTRNRYMEFVFVLGVEGQEHLSTVLVFPSQSERDSITQSLVASFDLLPDLHSNPQMEYRIPTQTFRYLLMQAQRKTTSERTWNHFLYFRDRNQVTPTSSEDEKYGRDNFLLTLSNPPFSAYRYQIRAHGFYEQTSNCPFAAHQAIDKVVTTFQGLQWHASDLCEFQPNAGSTRWKESFKEAATSIHALHARAILSCPAIGPLVVKLKGRVLKLEEQYTYATDSNEVVLTQNPDSPVQIDDALEVSYECAL